MFLKKQGKMLKKNKITLKKGKQKKCLNKGDMLEKKTRLKFQKEKQDKC